MFNQNQPSNFSFALPPQLIAQMEAEKTFRDKAEELKGSPMVSMSVRRNEKSELTTVKGQLIGSLDPTEDLKQITVQGVSLSRFPAKTPLVFAGKLVEEFILPYVDARRGQNLGIRVFPKEVRLQTTVLRDENRDPIINPETGEFELGPQLLVVCEDAWFQEYVPVLNEVTVESLGGEEAFAKFLAKAGKVYQQVTQKAVAVSRQKRLEAMKVEATEEVAEVRPSRSRAKSKAKAEESQPTE